MSTVKARIQGNALVVTIPKFSKVKAGTEYNFNISKNGTLTFTPTKEEPTSLKDLLKDWHGEYSLPEDLEDWQDSKPVGEEIW
ncbi:type II toxin-antitoxin system PemI/MazE family antitoxin [Lactobacillus corticis]|nr:hypothetical protein [Lactobacillus corticis]